jgi:putative ABC transport system substrate-binding protein
MRRRQFIGLLGGAALNASFAHAQQSAAPVVGYLTNRSVESEATVRRHFLKALEDAGLKVGRNVTIEYRYGDGNDERLPALASDLVRRPVALLFAGDGPSTRAAKAATSTIPIVFTSGFDPARAGIVESLNKPGGNATGFFLFTTQLGPKRLGLLREYLPKPGLIAFLGNARNGSNAIQLKQMQDAAKALEQPLLVLNVENEGEIDSAFKAMDGQQVKGIVYGATPLFQVMSSQFIAFADKYKIPAVYEWRDATVAGGLMSYSPSRAEIGRVTGDYVAQILKGAKAADLPVVQSSSFEFVINLKTARNLAIEVPPTLLARADEVIE